MGCRRLTELGAIVALLLNIMVPLTGAVAWAGSKPAGQVAYVGLDSNIYYCRADCSKRLCATCPVPRERAGTGRLTPALDLVQVPEITSDYSLPTYSPDGSKLAYASAGRSEQGYLFGVHAFDVAKREALTLFENPQLRPIYLYWADPQRLFFLTTDGVTVNLMMATVDGSGQPTTVVQGRPMYFDYNERLRQLAFHTRAVDQESAERLALVDPLSPNPGDGKVLYKGPAPFKAPAWSPDRRFLAYVVRQKGETALMVAPAGGTHPRRLLTLPAGECSLEWSPDSRQLAYAVAPGGESADVYKGVTLVSIKDGHTRNLITDRVAAYFFSPNGQHLAYIEVPPSGFFYNWKIVELKTGRARRLTSFLTTREEALVYHYFDQLALSHRIWSPDSTALTFAGVIIAQNAAGDGTLPPVASPPSIWFLSTGRQAPKKLADGTISFFAP